MIFCASSWSVFTSAIVGAVAGVGWSAGLDVDTRTLITIVEVWVVCPILTALLAFALYHALSRVLRRLRGLLAADRFVHGLLLASSAYVAYTMGASNAGKAVGPIANLDLAIDQRFLPILGGIAFVIGILSFGRRVANTIGGGIVRLGANRARFPRWRSPSRASGRDDVVSRWDRLEGLCRDDRGGG